MAEKFDFGSVPVYKRGAPTAYAQDQKGLDKLLSQGYSEQYIPNHDVVALYSKTQRWENKNHKPVPAAEVEAHLAAGWQREPLAPLTGDAPPPPTVDELQLVMADNESLKKANTELASKVDNLADLVKQMLEQKTAPKKGAAA